MSRTNKVFVYGTLRHGESNHRLLEKADLIAEHCWTNGKMYDTGNGYPAIKQSTTDKVYGELYAVNQGELNRLDILEGYVAGRNDNLYDRVIQTIYTDVEVMEAFVYVFCNERILESLIPSGDWKKYS
jgi:gamma-glutamylcyclotransferase (GGCT)/AIG2-like uncharacterized protein YtfP